MSGIRVGVLVHVPVQHWAGGGHTNYSVTEIGEIRRSRESVPLLIQLLIIPAARWE